eukprot:8220131-Heterocapsa_arctica.AAC.1
MRRGQHEFRRPTAAAAAAAATGSSPSDTGQRPAVRGLGSWDGAPPRARMARRHSAAQAQSHGIFGGATVYSNGA